MLPEPRVADALMQALRAGDAVALGRALSNDLQRAALALRPRLAMTLELGAECGALGALVSGSGPTCAFLARDEEHSLDLAVALTAGGVCRTVKRAQGPVHGARLVATTARSRRGGPGVTLLAAEGVGIAYGTRTVLDGVSLGVAAGDRIGVVGRNGGGKSTLLRLLAGDEQPDAGRVIRGRRAAGRPCSPRTTPSTRPRPSGTPWSATRRTTSGRGDPRARAA